MSRFLRNILVRNAWQAFLPKMHGIVPVLAEENSGSRREPHVPEEFHAISLKA